MVTMSYELVPKVRSQIKENCKLTNSQRLIRQRSGDIAEIQVPNGLMKFEIVDISR